MKSGTLPGNQQHSAKEVYDGLRSRGVPPDNSVSAVAIAYRESRFNDKAYCINYNNRGTDRGIFQFNNIAWPKLSDADAYDFEKNLDFYVSASKKGTNWAPWGGVPTHDMRQQAADLINGGQGLPGSDPNNDPSSGNIIGNPNAGTLQIPIISNIVDFLNWIVSHLGSAKWWLNVAKTLSGLWLIAFGLVQLAHIALKTPLPKSAIGTAVGAVGDVVA